MKYALLTILLIYFFFASGLSYEIFTPNTINHVESPYNIGLSSQRTGIVGIAGSDDIETIQWLKNNTPERKIVSDYNGYCMLHGFVQNHVDNLRYGSLTDIHKDDLVFLSSWNIENGKYIEAIGVGLRESYDLPDFGLKKYFVQPFGGFAIAEDGSKSINKYPIDYFGTSVYETTNPDYRILHQNQCGNSMILEKVQ